MSYTYKVLWDGEFYDIPNYEGMSFGVEYNDVSAITFKYARDGVNADVLRNPYATIITYWKGVEIKNGRYIVLGVNDSYDPVDSYFTVQGRSLFDIFRKVICRNPASPGTSYRFTNATPGGILHTLFVDAQMRGAMTGITWSFTPTKTSGGKDWAKKVTIEYKPGTKYIDIIRNMADQGLLDFEFNGTQLSGYNDSENCEDFTDDTGQFIELRAGVDYEEMPSRMSAEARANYSLIVGNNDVWMEATRAPEGIGPYGREEQALSQGGMDDPVSIALVNENSLFMASRTKNEYTRKVIIRDGGPIPGVDYKPGDWIFDRVDGLPVRYRVISVGIGVDDRGQAISAALTLNDRIQEFGMRLARKVDGIIGGASADGSGNGIPSTRVQDRTVPRPPTGLQAESSTYADNNGYIQGAASATWLPPTTNVDGSTITDLSHYEIEHQTNGKIAWQAPSSIGPMKLDRNLSVRFDRRGITTPGWVGADGGGNWESNSGMVYHAWGDTMWGTITSSGKRNAFMPRNSITMFDPKANNKNLTTFVGTENVVPLTAARCDTLSTWTGLTNAAASVVAWAEGYNGLAVQLRSTAAGLVAAQTSLNRTTSQNNLYRPVRAGKSYRVMCKFDPSTPMDSPRVNIIWRNNSETILSTSQCGSTSGVVDALVTAPANATTATFQVLGTATAASQTIKFSMPGFFETTHRMANWRLPAPTHTVVNEVANPDAVGGTSATQTRRNQTLNPSFYNDLSNVTPSGGATLVRDLQYVHNAPEGVPGLEIVNPAGLNTWRTALAARATAQANVVVTGTSVSSGLSTTNFVNRYQTRLQDILRRNLPVNGVKAGRSGYQGVQGFIPGWYQADPTCPSLPGPGGQKSGGVVTSANGLGGQALHLNAGDFRRFTATFTNFRLLLIVDTSTGGPLEITVDGQTWNTNTQILGTSMEARFWECPATFASVEHVVEVRNVDKEGRWSTVIFGGIELLDGDKGKGVHVYDGAHSGWAAQDNVTNPNIARSVAATKPHLVTIELGYNDAGRGRTSAQVKADIQTTMEQIRSACTSAGKPTPSFLLVGGYDPGSAQYGNPANPQGAWPEPWPNYLAAMKTLATGDVAFVDLSTIMPRISDDTTGLYDGAIHPTDKGHAFIAKALEPVLNVSSTLGKKASVRVTTKAATASSGWQTSNDAAANWANGDTWTYSAWVKAPVGAKLQLVSDAPPTTTTRVNIVGTGDWQRASVTGTYGGTPTNGPMFAIRTADTTQGAFTFWVSEVLLEKSSTVGDYFDGETASTVTSTYGWTSTRYASHSTEVAPKPNGWTGTGTHSVVKGRYNATAARVVGGTSVLVPLVATTTSSASTMSSWVFSATGGVARAEIRAGATVAIRGVDVTLQPGVWTEVRAEGSTASGITNVSVVVTGSNDWTVCEVTYVADQWSGGTFSGNSRNQENIACSWLGTANNSRSQAVFSNSNYVELGFNFFGEIATADRPAQLVSSMSIPGGNATEWLWASDGCVTTMNRAVVFYPAVISQASVTSGWNFGFNGSYYIAEYDLGTNTMLRFRRWSRDPRGGVASINWGNAVISDSNYLYVFGSRALPTDQSKNNNYVCRISLSGQNNAVFTNTPDVWNGSAWVSATADPGLWENNASTTPASIAVTPGAGFSSVRTWDGSWYALVMGGLTRDLTMWKTSTGPHLGWAQDSVLYTMPSGKMLGYSPKFQIASDSSRDGVAALLCQSSGETVMNPTLYIPAWLRGPGGAGKAMTGDTWIDHSDVYNPPFIKGGLKPGTAYAFRVRAVDNANPPNYSQWVGSDPIVVASDIQGPPKPSTPLVTPFFQGARVTWDGLDEGGQSMPSDYNRFEVHISEDQSFVPTPATMADSMTTRGGVAPIQGLTYGTVYWVRVVAFDNAGNASEPSDAVSVEPQRLSDPDLPDKLITGAKIADKAISVSNLTVGAFSNNLLPNANMEDKTAAGTIAGWVGYFTEDPTADSTSPIAGSSSMRYDVTGGNKNVLSPAVPITPGDVYYLALKVRTSRPLDRASVTAVLALAENESKAGSGFGQDIRLGAVGTTGGTTIVTLESQAEVPWDDMIKFGRLSVLCEAESTPYTVWFDDFELKRVVGEAAIANASINTAKIKNLAVDNSKISDLSVGKVTAGRVYADWVQSGRFRTTVDSNGSWSLFDSVGFHTYKDAAGTNKSFSTEGGNVYASGVIEGSEIRGGSAWFPSQYADVPGRTSIGDQGLSVDAVPTKNLCTNPSFELSTPVYVGTGAEIALDGALVTDYAGNIDLVARSGRYALKVWNKTANSSIAIEVGRAVANTTYTVSWHSATTSINNEPFNSGYVYGDFSKMGVLRADTNEMIANGRSGYVLREGALQGLWAQPKASGIEWIASKGWMTRMYVTFKTPADLPANTMLRLQLPTPRTSGGGNETTLAVCYDGFQLEQKAWMTRYCDGDQPGCSWDGARYKSTSTRGYVRTLWASSQDDPVFQGSVRASSFESKRIKVGSGVTHGSNAVETLMGNGWSVWNGGAGWWSQIPWDNQYTGMVTLTSRYSSDDGVMFPAPQNGGSTIFTTVTGGMYSTTATITFPSPQQRGVIGLRIKHISPTTPADGSGSILAQNFQGSDMPTNIVTVSWTGWSPPGWRIYFEAFQTTQSGSATMPSHDANTPCRAAIVQHL